MSAVRFHSQPDDHLLHYAVVFARSGGKWVLCRHHARTTWELPGGRREPGEDILTTARRELYEETGALRYELTPLSAFSAPKGDAEDYGMLYFAKIYEFEPALHSEIAEIRLFDALPEDNWTYPGIQPALIQWIKPCLYALENGKAKDAS